MRVSRGVDVPPVDIVQARRILKVAKGYKELKEKMEILIALNLLEHSFMQY